MNFLFNEYRCFIIILYLIFKYFLPIILSEKMYNFKETIKYLVKVRKEIIYIINEAVCKDDRIIGNL